AIDALVPGTVDGWMAYVGGVAWALREAGDARRGVDLGIVSDLPIAAGLSSSAAIEMADPRSMTAANGALWTPQAMARIGQRVENEFIGVATGIMDQFASAASVTGSALLLDCRSLETRLVPIPGGIAVVVMDTGV